MVLGLGLLLTALFTSTAFAQEAPPTCNGLTATIYVDDTNTIIGGPDDGSAYAGTLNGTDGDDVIVGTDTGDTVLAGNGNDTICTGTGDDNVDAGEGDNWIFTDAGDDILVAGSGDDVLNAGTGTDLCDGGAGNTSTSNCDSGTITIIKSSRSSQDFSFSGDLGDFSLDDDSNETLSNQYSVLTYAGSYNVTEDAAIDWELTSISCTGDNDNGTTIDLTTQTATIDLDNGESITCTYTNQITASRIIIIKDASPDSDQDFSFSGDLGEFTLDDDNDDTLANTFTVDRAAGTYTITEAEVDGWSLSDIDCGEFGGVSIDLANRSVTLEMSVEDLVSCTFTNTEDPKGTIVIVKNTDPDNAQDFTYSGDLGDFALDDDGDNTLSNTYSVITDPGTYTVTEASVSGWDLTSLICSDTSNTTLDQSNRSVTIGLLAGETVTCTFTSAPQATTTPTSTGGGGGVPIEVIRQITPQPTVTPAPSSTPTPTPVVNMTPTLPVPTVQPVFGPQSLSCPNYLNSFIGLKIENNPGDVYKLELFLNEEMNSRLDLNSTYDLNDYFVVRDFQEKYRAQILDPWGIQEPTGFVYLTTQRWINQLKCPENYYPLPDLVPYSQR